MYKNNRVQIPITAEKKALLEAKSIQLGFDSITDSVRYLINCFLNGRINISIGSEYVEIPSKETEVAVLEGLLEVAKGKTKKLDFNKNIHKQLMQFADE